LISLVKIELIISYRSVTVEETDLDENFNQIMLLFYTILI